MKRSKTRVDRELRRVGGSPTKATNESVFGLLADGNDAFNGINDADCDLDLDGPQPFPAKQPRDCYVLRHRPYLASE